MALSVLMISTDSCCGQARKILFENERYGLSDGIWTFFLAEDSSLDAIHLFRQDTSIIDINGLYMEPITFSEVYQLISNMNYDESCTLGVRDSFIVRYYECDSKTKLIGCICFASSVDYFTLLNDKISKNKNWSPLSEFFKICVDIMKDAEELRAINRR